MSLVQSDVAMLNSEHSGSHSSHQAMSREQESVDFEPTYNYLQGRNDSRQLELNRIFVVVMDYDPHSLCITGRPDLELSVQSGKS